MLITNPFRKITTERGGGGRGANGRYFRRERVINTREGTQGKEGRCLLHAMSRSHHAFRCRVCTLHYLTSSSSSSENGRREKLERTAATATAMQKGEEPISEPNWAAERPFVRSPVGSTWKCGSSCFQTRMGERGRKEGEREGARMGAPILQRDRSDHHQNH